MLFIFYILSLITVLTAYYIIICKNPIYALLYLLIFILSISGIFFSIKVSFIGFLEIVIYASAIMVLFVFIIITINIDSEYKYKKNFFIEKFIPLIISIIFCIFILYGIVSYNHNKDINNQIFTTKDIGISLFNNYFLVVEIASLLLLSGLIASINLGNKIYNSKHFDTK